MECDECGTNVPSDAEYCPNCGHRVNGDHQQSAEPEDSESSREQSAFQRSDQTHQSAADGQIAELIEFLREDPRVRIGAIYGGGAYLVGYLFAYLLTVLGGGWQIPKYVAAGLIFYGMHFVPSAAGGRSATLGGGFEWAWPVIALLVASGYLVVARGGTATDQWTDGAAIIAGYLPLAVVGTVIFSTRTTDPLAGSITIRPEFLPAVVSMGLLFPGICGAIGGRIAKRRREST